MEKDNGIKVVQNFCALKLFNLCVKKKKKGERERENEIERNVSYIVKCCIHLTITIDKEQKMLISLFCLKMCRIVWFRTDNWFKYPDLENSFRTQI